MRIERGWAVGGGVHDFSIFQLHGRFRRMRRHQLVHRLRGLIFRLGPFALHVRLHSIMILSIHLGERAGIADVWFLQHLGNHKG